MEICSTPELGPAITSCGANSSNNNNTGPITLSWLCDCRRAFSLTAPGTPPIRPPSWLPITQRPLRPLGTIWNKTEVKWRRPPPPQPPVSSRFLAIGFTRNGRPIRPFSIRSPWRPASSNIRKKPVLLHRNTPTTRWRSCNPSNGNRPPAVRLRLWPSRRNRRITRVPVESTRPCWTWGWKSRPKIHLR